MAERELGTIEEGPGERKQIDCIEVYLPKSLEFLSELYRSLRDMVDKPLGSIALDGFSVYEVDGVFRGQQRWEQRTLIIRLLLIRPADYTSRWLNDRITLLGKEISTKVAAGEEEIWICHYPQILTIFRGWKRLST